MLGKRVIDGIDLSRVGAKLALAMVLSAGFNAASASPSLWAQTTQNAGRPDSAIQSDVASALSNSRSLKLQHITAATVEGDVTISGNVRDEASKELAESLLYRVNGVRSVTNNLVVGDAAPLPVQGQMMGGDSNLQSTDTNQDPNYDPAQQNMAPAGPQDQTQSAPMQPRAPEQPQSPSSAPAPRQPYSQQPYPQQQYGQQQSAYAQQQQTYPQQPEQPSTPVAIPSGTLLQIRTVEPLDATRIQPGQVFSGTVAADVYAGPVLAVPRGAVVTGKVVATQGNRGELAGKQGLSLTLTSINLASQSYTLVSDTWSGEGPGKGGYSARNTIGTAGVGALIGALAGGGAGAAIGAGAGAVVGAGASAATGGPRMYVPAEAVINFHLTASVTVTPVSLLEAQRLASNAQPRLQRRGEYPYGAYPPPPPPPPGYYYYPYRSPVAYSPYYYYRYR